jgi:hypothetical protein
MGWQWQMSRCEAPNRVARHWLVLAVATRWVLGCGTRVDDAAQLETTSDRVRVPPDLPTSNRTRDDQPVPARDACGSTPTWARAVLAVVVAPLE